MRRWVEECDRDVFFILLLKDKECLRNKGAGLLNGWSSSDYNVVCFSDEEFSASVLSEKMELLKNTWANMQSTKRTNDGVTLNLPEHS